MNDAGNSEPKTAAAACKRAWLLEQPTDDLLGELGRRGLHAGTMSAIGALQDQLKRSGAMKDMHTRYLMYRVRREWARIDSALDPQEREKAACHWQACIDSM